MTVRDVMYLFLCPKCSSDTCCRVHHLKGTKGGIDERVCLYCQLSFELEYKRHRWQQIDIREGLF